jgi:hypothetical protein
MKKNKKIKYYMNIIKKMENVRKANNINWMDLLRLSFKTSPEEAKKILSKIYADDKKISNLLKKLNS